MTRDSDQDTVNFAGVSRQNGTLKFRASNRASYGEILRREGKTDVQIIQLPHPMTKEQAKRFIGGLKEFQSEEILVALGIREASDLNFRNLRSEHGDLSTTTVDDYDGNTVRENTMKVLQGLEDWMNDGAGLLFGSFVPSFQVSEDQQDVTVIIDLAGTPSTFLPGGRQFLVTPDEEGASVSVKINNDGRQVRLIIETSELGFCSVFAYPNITISPARKWVAFEFANFANSRSTMSFMYFVSRDKLLNPCFKATSAANGDPELFENICFTVLQMTYHLWDALMLASATELGIEDIVDSLK